METQYKRTRCEVCGHSIYVMNGRLTRHVSSGPRMPGQAPRDCPGSGRRVE